jgi:hypothetical protein
MGSQILSEDGEIPERPYHSICETAVRKNTQVINTIKLSGIENFSSNNLVSSYKSDLSEVNGGKVSYVGEESQQIPFTTGCYSDTV